MNDSVKLENQQALLIGRINHFESHFRGMELPRSYEALLEEAKTLCTNSVSLSSFGRVSHKLYKIILHVMHLRDFVWADLSRDNVLIDVLTRPCAHSSNEDATLRALEKHAQPDTTSWFLVDVVSAHLRGAGIAIEQNFIDSYGPDEYWYLTHAGPNRPGYKYHKGVSSTSVFGSLNTDWNVIKFDADRHSKLREGCYG